MKLVIPANLTDLNIVIQMNMMLNEYADNYYEDQVFTGEQYQKLRNYDYVRTFIELTGNRDTYTNDYIANMFYKVKGTREVFNQMENHLGIKFKSVVYNINQLTYEFESINTSYNRVVDFKQSLMNFLRTLLYFVNDGTDTNGNDGELEEPINNSKYVFTGSNGGKVISVGGSNSGNSGVIDIISTKDDKYIGYSVTNPNSWITVSIDEDGNLSYSIDPNNTNSTRNGVIILTQDESGNAIVIKVTQNAGSSIDPTDPTYIFTSGDGNTNIREILPNNEEYIGNIPIVSTKDGKKVDYSVTSSNPDWIYVSVTNDGNLTYKVTENPSESPRSGVITLVQDGSGKTITIVVGQPGSSGTKPTEPDPESEYIFTDSDGNTYGLYKSLDDNKSINGSVQLVSTKDGFPIGYSVTSNSSWLTVTNTRSGFSYVATENTSTDSRSGVITVVQEESGNTYTYTVVQGGKSDTPIGPVDPGGGDEPGTGGDDYKYIFTDSNGNTEATDDSHKSSNIAFSDYWEMISTRDGKYVNYSVTSSASWLTVRVNELGYIEYSADENDGSSSRTATIVGLQDGSGNIFMLTVTQGILPYDPDDPYIPTEPEIPVEYFQIIIDDEVLSMSTSNLVMYKEFYLNYEGRDQY